MLEVAGHALRVVVHARELEAGFAHGGIAGLLHALDPLRRVARHVLAQALVVAVAVTTGLVAPVAGLLVGGQGVGHVAGSALRLLVHGSGARAAVDVAAAEVAVAGFLEEARGARDVLGHARPVLGEQAQAVARPRLMRLAGAGEERGGPGRVARRARARFVGQPELIAGGHPAGVEGLGEQRRRLRGIAGGTPAVEEGEAELAAAFGVTAVAGLPEELGRARRVGGEADAVAVHEAEHRAGARDPSLAGL